MFERFTERARQVLILGQDEARALKHNYLGTEHILLGLLREEEGLAARALEALDVEINAVRVSIGALVGTGVEETPRDQQIPFTPRAKKVCELALREALSLGHNYIGTEHLLLAIARENSGHATMILDEAEADAPKIREQVTRLLVSGKRVPPPQIYAAGTIVKPANTRRFYAVLPDGTRVPLPQGTVSLEWD